MRRTCSLSATLALAALFALAACSQDADEPASPTTTEAPTEAPKEAPKGPTRPPFPNMATAAWGATVMEERVQAADTGGALSSHISSALQALHSLDGRAATSLQKSGASIHATGENDGDRALGAALLAVGLVLDDAPRGYKERLTDAHGLAAYAGTLEGGTAVAQAARAFVAVSAGRVYEGQKLVDVMSTSSRIDPDSALLLALARFTLGQRSDELLEQAQKALDGKPDSARARALLARTYLDVGLPSEALRVLDAGKGALGDKADEPALLSLRGQALLALGEADEAARVLEKALASLDDVQRGEALYRLGSFAASSGDAAKAEEHLSQLSSLLGFEGEVTLLEARVALLRGDAAKAKAAALEVCKARGAAFAVAHDCLWAATEACAAAGDEACVDEWGRKAAGSDDDFARLSRARATLASVKAGRVQQASAGQGAAADASLDDATRAQLTEAHLLSPFDAALGQRLGLPVARGGDDVARTVSGARRAIAFGARKAATEALTKLIKAEPTCRVCRAVFAFAPKKDADEAARRAAAAVKGKGPPLAERDLLAVIDALGGSAIDEAKAALEQLSRDPRARVKEAVATAKKDQVNPEARAARKAKEAEAATQAPGTVPVPGSTGHGHHE